MEPYTYVITFYPTQEQYKQGINAEIVSSGMIIASDQKDAFVKMLEKVSSEHDPESIEFMAKPFMDESSCSTKKEIGNNILYNFYLNDNVYELRSGTVSLSDFMSNTFLNNNYQYNQPLPKVMMMIDVLALTKEDNKL